MNQLFYNLVGNALKFTVPDRAPVITLTYQLKDTEGAGAFIPNPPAFSKLSSQTTVSDLTVSSLPRFLRYFKRLHASRKYQGSGIGLALCRGIVTNHNGYICAESGKNHGSVFHIFPPESGSTLRLIGFSLEIFIFRVFWVVPKGSDFVRVFILVLPPCSSWIQ